MKPALPLPPPGFMRQSGLALLATAVLLVLLAQFSDLDLALADRSFDAALRQFARPSAAPETRATTRA